MNHGLRLFILILICALTSCEKERQRIITGTIIDQATGEPIANNTYELHIAGNKTGPTLSQQRVVASYSFVTDSFGNFEVAFECKSNENVAITYRYDKYDNGNWLWSDNVGKDDMLIGAGVIKANKEL